MTMAAARHIRRAQGQRLLDQLASDYLDRPEVDRAPMFGSLGLRVNGKFFAFVGAEGQLVTKLPEAQAAALVAKGQADPRPHARRRGRIRALAGVVGRCPPPMQAAGSQHPPHAGARADDSATNSTHQVSGGGIGDWDVPVPSAPLVRVGLDPIEVPTDKIRHVSRSSPP